MQMRHASAQPTIGVLEQVEQDDQLDRLSVALDALPEDERLVIHLYYLEADPPAAGLAALGVSRSQFYRVLQRARDRLALLMREAASHEHK